MHVTAPNVVLRDQTVQRTYGDAPLKNFASRVPPFKVTQVHQNRLIDRVLITSSQ